jgi:hypothetical protein
MSQALKIPIHIHHTNRQLFHCCNPGTAFACYLGEEKGCHGLPTVLRQKIQTTQLNSAMRQVGNPWQWLAKGFAWIANRQCIALYTPIIYTYQMQGNHFTCNHPSTIIYTLELYHHSSLIPKNRTHEPDPQTLFPAPSIWDSECQLLVYLRPHHRPVANWGCRLRPTSRPAPPEFVFDEKNDGIPTYSRYYLHICLHVGSLLG